MLREGHTDLPIGALDSRLAIGHYALLDGKPQPSEALILYLGKGLTPYPTRDPQRLVDRYGSIEATDLVAYCDKVLEELYDTAPDWATEDLATATERAVGVVAARHPELSTEALASLRWSYSWNWK